MRSDAIYPNSLVVSDHIRSVRGSGYTTTLALNVLSTAVAHPGKWVAVIDHFQGFADGSGKNVGHRAQLKLIKMLADTLGIPVSDTVDADHFYIQCQYTGAQEKQYVKR